MRRVNGAGCSWVLAPAPAASAAAAPLAGDRRKVTATTKGEGGGVGIVSRRGMCLMRYLGSSLVSPVARTREVNREGAWCEARRGKGRSSELTQET